MRISHADFLAMQARCNAGMKRPSEVVESGATENESALHNSIIAFCKHRLWIYFHGSMVSRTARTIGEPDFTILADKGRVFFIECKTKIGKLTPEQLGIKMWAERLGHQIHVVRSVDEFLRLVNAAVEEPPTTAANPTSQKESR